MQINKAVAETLKSLRNTKKVSQEKLAEELNSHQVYISEIESGKKLPSLIILYKYSKIFNIKLYELVKLIEEKMDK